MLTIGKYVAHRFLPNEFKSKLTNQTRASSRSELFSKKRSLWTVRFEFCANETHQNEHWYEGKHRIFESGTQAEQVHNILRTFKIRIMSRLQRYAIKSIGRAK